MRIRAALLMAALAVAVCAASLAAVRQTPAAAAPTPEQLQMYETFRAWITKQPATLQQAPEDVVFTNYAGELKRQGQSARDIASTIDTLKRLGGRAEVERWNRILTAPKPMFNTAPNAFLVEMIKGVKPGRALDVGMGQGRNTIYLDTRVVRLAAVKLE